MIKILIADDDPHMLMLSSLLFQEQGFELIEAKNGTEAIDKALLETPDLILSDIIMPDKGGLEVCKTLKSNPKLQHIPVILISAVHDQLYVKSSYQAGASHFIQKPFEPAELLNTIQSHLDNSRPKNTRNIQNTTKQTLKNTKLRLPFQNIFKQHLEEHSNLLLKGPVGSGKKLFMSKIIYEYLLYENGQVIYLSLSNTPQKLIQQLINTFGPFITSLLKQNKLCIVNGTPASYSGEFQSIVSVSNHFDSHLILDSLTKAKTLFTAQHSSKKILFCIDAVNHLMLPNQFLSFCNFIQLLTQSEDFFSQDLCIFVQEEPCSLMQSDTFSYMMDIDISFIKNQTSYLLKFNYLKQMNIKSDWQGWKADSSLILK